MIIGGLNPQIHQCDIVGNADCIAGVGPDHQPDAVTLIKNSISFAASGFGTGLYASLSRYYQSAPTDTPVSFLSDIGLFKVVGITGGVRNFNAVTIDEPGHPVMAGLSNAGLSGWAASIHQFLEDFPGTFIPVATGGAPGDALGPLPVIIATPVP